MYFDIIFTNDFGNETNRRLMLLEKAANETGPAPQPIMLKMVKLAPGAYVRNGADSQLSAFNAHLRVAKAIDGSETRAFLPVSAIFDTAKNGISPGTTVTRATVFFFASGADTFIPGVRTLHAVTDPNATGNWLLPNMRTNEPGSVGEFMVGDGVSWIKKTAGINWETVGGTYDPQRHITGSNQAQLLSFDITLLVNDWSHGVIPERGVILSTDTGQASFFNGLNENQGYSPIVLLEMP